MSREASREGRVKMSQKLERPQSRDKLEALIKSRHKIEMTWRGDELNQIIKRLEPNQGVVSS